MAPGIELHVPEDLRNLYEVYEYRHAAALLYSEFPDLYKELCDGLRAFRFTRRQLENGGNEREIPKIFSDILRPTGWLEGKFSVSLVVDGQELRQDTYKINYIKGRVAFDLEWNSKDRTFDQDFLTIRTLFDYDRISVCVLVIRSERLNSIFREMNILQKYGASTVHLGKLLPSLKAGRAGGCPLLVFGITEMLVKDL